MSSNSNNSADKQIPDLHERFELLSAYMDNEVNPAEKAQVEQWLDADPNFRRLYQRQLKLRQLLVSLPTPSVESSPASAKANTEFVIDRVMAKLDKRSQRRKWFLGGSVAVAAVVVGALGSVFTFGNPEGQLKLANHAIPSAAVQKSASEEPLLLAMEKPIVPLPKSMKATQNTEP